MLQANVGQKVRVRAAWSANQLATDPGTKVARVLDPTGAVTTPTIFHDSIGADHIEFELTSGGTWWVRFEGTDPVAAADEIAIAAEPSVFPVV